MAAADPVLLSVDAVSGVATVTLNRPDSLNALNVAMTQGLRETFSEIAGRRDIRAVLLTGAGDHFMAGGDIRVFAEFNTRPREERPDLARPLIKGVGEAISTLRAMPQPVVACVQGACAGFGLSLANACDMTIAAEDAYFTLAYINIGTSPDGSGSFFLPRLVGPKRAAEIALLGGRFDASTAERWGMVNAIHPRADLEAEATKVVARLAAMPSGALARTKALLNQAMSNDLSTQLNAEEDSFAACTATADWEEGIGAFLERRTPTFNTGD